MEVEIRRSIVSGSVRAVPSVPLAHRALLASSLAYGQSVLSNVLFTQGVKSTLSACNSFGADIVTDEKKGVADVFGAAGASFQPRLDCGESNTTLKLLLPLAALFSGPVEFSGGAQLSKKPLGPYAGYLERLGARCSSASGFLPLRVAGPISEGEIVVLPKLGTQFFSGLLMALPLLKTDTHIGIDGEFSNRGYFDSTIELMQKCGIRFPALSQDVIVVEGRQQYSPLEDYQIPASSYLSSYYLLAGAVGGRVSVQGAKPEQSFANLLGKFGAHLKISGETATASAGRLSSCELSAPELQSYLPHALVLASLADGETKFSGLALLGKQQSGRMRHLLSELKKMGAQSAESDGSLIVRGGKLRGASLHSGGDCAAACALFAAALASDGASRLSGASAVEKSFPGFFRGMSLLGAIAR